VDLVEFVLQLFLGVDLLEVLLVDDGVVEFVVEHGGVELVLDAALD